MKRLLSRAGLRERVTLSLTVRALAISVAVFALVITFAVFGGYQGIRANESQLQQQKHSQSQQRDQRIANQRATDKEIQQGFCDVVYYFDEIGAKKKSPFIEHLRQVHKCDPASAHPPAKQAKKKLLAQGQPGGTTSSGPPRANGGSTPVPNGTRRPGGGKTPPTSHPSPSPTPSPSPRPPILGPVCKLVDPILHLCVTG